jgi:3-oxoacyl-[acyl-carrier protein] reductase
MKKKAVLVTGSNRGIGRDIALHLGKRTGRVAVHYQTHKPEAMETVREIQSEGAEAVAFRADLRDAGQAEGLVHDVQNMFGRVDILVNNVGPILVKPWLETTAEDWEETLRMNLGTALACMKAVLPDMREHKWGRIVNLGYSRVEQLTAFPTIVSYAAAKASLLILTRTAASTEASFGITVNMVSPGLIEGGVLPQDQNVPQGRLGTFEDVSHAVGFLASEEAGYITGMNLVVAGGWKL